MRRVTVGVFQGSIGGPVIFIIFVNDIDSLSFDTIINSVYADDTTILKRLTGYPTDLKDLHKYLSKLVKYMYNNNLKINSDKTQVVLVHPPRVPNASLNYNVTIENQNIKCSHAAKLLGCYVTDDASQSHYLINSPDSVLNYLETRLRALKIICNRVNPAQKKLLVQGMINSKICYCICYWFDALQTELNQRIHVIQSKAIRLIHNRPIFTRLHELYKEVDMLGVEMLAVYHDTIQLKSIIESQTPLSLAEGLSESFRQIQAERRAEAANEAAIDAPEIEPQAAVEEDPELEGRRITRAMARGEIPIDDETMPDYTPRRESFLCRAALFYNLYVAGQSWGPPTANAHRQNEAMKKE